MDVIPDCTPPLPGRLCSQWNASNRYVMDFERVVRAVEGNTLILDAPLVQSIERGDGTVYKATDQRVEQVGVTDLRLVSDFDSSVTATYGSPAFSYVADEAHGWTALAFDNVRDAWTHSLHCIHFGFSCVHVQSGAKHVTVENATSLSPISVLTGGRRYPFNVDGQLSLFRRCHSDLGRHSFVSGAIVLGPNVFAHCSSSRDYSDIGPHHRIHRLQRSNLDEQTRSCCCCTDVHARWCLGRMGCRAALRRHHRGTDARVGSWLHGQRSRLGGQHHRLLELPVACLSQRL
jgi:hypothetical protein